MWELDKLVSSSNMNLISCCTVHLLTFVWRLSQVYLTYLRLVTPSEVDTIDSLLPKVAMGSVSEKGKKPDNKVQPVKDDRDRRQQMVLDQYKQLLAGLQFLSAPSVMDLVAVLGTKNAALSARVVKGLCEFRLSFAKEVNDSLKESVKVTYSLFFLSLLLK